MKKLILIGFMGAGKSTLGRRIHQRYGTPLIDLDGWIERHEGKGIPQIFEEKGEKGFRKLEREALEILSDQLGEHWVLSCGGGTPVYRDNMEQLSKMGTTIYLKSPPEELLLRLKPQRKTRPLLKDIPEENLEDFIGQMLKERAPIYEKAHVILHSYEWTSFIENLDQGASA